MIRRIMKYGTRDFYKLSRNKQLPSETINYVPKVLAAMHIVNNAKAYGFELPKKQHRLFDQTVLIPAKRNVTLQSIAKNLNVDHRILKKLNPELRRNITPRHFAGTYMLRVPKSKYAYELAEEVKTSAPVVATITTLPKFSRPESRKELNRRTAAALVPKIHRVRKGDTIINLAKAYKTTPRALAENNNLSSWRAKLKVGQRLQLAPNKATLSNSSAKVKLTNRPIVYKVARGDRLTDIARLFNSPMAKIKSINKLKRGKILVGQKLVLPNTQKGIYTVRRGDHLMKVAKDFNLPISTLLKINSLKRNTIYPGQKIIVNMD